MSTVSSLIGSSGLGSGLDITSIVSALVDAEKAPKQSQITSLTSKTSTQISALGQLTSSLNSFQSAVSALNDASLFSTRTAKSSNTSLVTVATDSTAQAGSYSVKVSQLATSSQTATAALSSGYTTSSAGTLTVRLGASDAGTTVSVASGASLTDIRDELNKQLADTGITASLITNPGDGTSRLVMTSDTTGAGKDVYITSNSLSDLTIGSNTDGTVGTLNAVSGSSSGYLQQAQDAAFSINGLALTSSSNTVSTAVSGVTFTLTGTDSSASSTVSIGSNTSGVTSAIQKFVTAYNSLISTTNTLTNVTPVSDGNAAPVTGDLVGDSTVRNVLSGIRNELSSPANQKNIRMLSDLGITTENDGTLTLDSTKLSTALSNNYDAVTTYLTGDTGLMSRLDNKITPYTETGGILGQRVSNLQSQLKKLDSQQTALNTRMTQYQTMLTAKYNAMDTLVSNMNSTASTISSYFSTTSTSG